MQFKNLAAAAAVTLTALSLAACGGSGTGNGGGSAGTTLTIAFNQNAEHPQAQAMTQAGAALEEATDGAYGLEVFPDELLGAQDETLEQVRSGTIDMAVVAGSVLEGINPDISVINLPYLYSSAEQQVSVLNDDAIVGELFDTLNADNLEVLAVYHAGARSLYTTDGPVTTPEDLAGQRIRVIESDTNIAMMELMGGVGAPMDMGEVYTAIQSGVLDGAENNELVYANMAHAEVAPYFSETRHLMLPDLLVINTGVLDAMDDESEAALREAVAASVDTEVELFATAVEEARTRAEEAGATFSEPDVEAFRAAVLPLHDEVVTSDSARAVYDAITAAAE